MEKLIFFKNTFYFNILCLITGALLPFAFSPFNWDFIAIIVPAMLLFIWFDASPRRSFFQGFLFGLGFFGVGVSWVFISIHQYGNTSAPIASLITILFVTILALFPAFQGYCFNKFFPQVQVIKHILVFPTLWVIFEWLRSWVFGGFPWLLLGYSQVSSPLRGLIPIIGTYGTSFIIALTGSILTLIIFKKIRWQLMLLLAVLITCVWVSSELLAKIEWTNKKGDPIKTTIIQGNIPQELKWKTSEVQNTFNTYWKLTRKNFESGIIVWPENAIPIPKQLVSDALQTINRVSQMKNTTLVVGIPIQAKDPFHYYNALITLGNFTGTYYKRHLVPFGEYLPFSKLLKGMINFFAIPMSDFLEGSSYQPLLYAQGVPFASFICYEIAYANLLLSDLPKAQLLITISDDSWFGRSIASAQHLQIAQMRSLESGRMQLFATNSGPSAIIDERGQIVKKLPLFKEAVLNGEITPRIGSTPWVTIGNTGILIFLIILLYLTWLFTRRNKLEVKNQHRP